MTDERSARDPQTAQSAEPVASTDSTPDAGADLLAGRRAFMRRLSGDAVWTAGRLAGISTVIRRSVVAAGEAATRDPETPLAKEPPAAQALVPVGTVVTSEPPPTPRAPDPVLALTAAQHDFLAMGTTAALAVNDPAGAPHITSSIYHWDGTTIRLPAQLFTARAEHVDRDPRVGLLIRDEVSRASVALSGVATVGYGDQVDEEIRMFLIKYLGMDETVRSLEELAASGDRIVLRVRPTRFVWRTG